MQVSFIKKEPENMSETKRGIGGDKLYGLSLPRFPVIALP